MTRDLNGMMDARNADVKTGWLPAKKNRTRAAIAQLFPISNVVHRNAILIIIILSPVVLFLLSSSL